MRPAEWPVDEERQREVGTSLRHMMERHGVTVSVLGELSGIHKGNLCRIMAGECPLYPTYAWRLARVLGQGVLTLIDGDYLLQRVDVRAAVDRRERGGFIEYVLPGGVRLRVPAGLGATGTA